MLTRLLFFFPSVFGLYFSLEPLRERCIGLSLQVNESYTCAYVVTGEGEYNVVARVVAPGGDIRFQSQQLTKEGKFSERTEETGRYRLCFRAFDRRQKRVSFDFTRDMPTLPDPSSDLFDEVLSLKDHTRTMHRLLDQVARNIRFTIERERAHRDLAEQTCERVLWCAGVKLWALLGVAGMQMAILGGVCRKASKDEV